MEQYASTWAIQEFSAACFGDERLARRCVALARALHMHAQSSIPQACQNWAATKGAYRFFGNNRVTSAEMLRAHQEQLRQQTAGHDTLLVAQDTTTLNLSNKQIAGVGLVGDGGSKKNPLQGLYVHSGLAMTTEGLPLGIAFQKIYARKQETTTAAYRKTIKTKPITEKETYRWIEAIQETKVVLPDKHLVVIGDRESDIYEVFAEGQALGVDLLVRTSQNRLLHESDGDIKLFDAAQQGDIVTTYEAEVPVDAHKTRQVSLTVRTTNIQLPPPKSRDKDKKRPVIPLTVLNVMEEKPPAGVTPLHWMLTTSCTVVTPDAALEKVTWYMYRWRIERFHYTLKTGAFNIEKLQFETTDRFAKAITLYSLVACRILHTLYYERLHPNVEAATMFSSQELRALTYREQRSNASLTLHEATTAIAKLGGYLARKSDGPPGIKALWSGFQSLQYIVEGILLAERGDVGKD